MASFDTLPTELLLKIFTHFRGDSSSLARSCRISVKICDVATNLLYQSIEAPTHRKALVRLAWTLLKHPALARLVTTFKCHMAANSYRNSLGEPDINKAELLGNCAIHLNRHYNVGRTTSIMGYMMNNLVEDWDSAWSALILTLLPNLLSLNFRMNEWSDMESAYVAPVYALYGLYPNQYSTPRIRPQLSQSLNTLESLSIPVENFSLFSFFEFTGLRRLELNLTRSDGMNNSAPPPKKRPGCLVSNVETLSVRSDWRLLTDLEQTRRPSGVFHQAWEVLRAPEMSNGLKTVEVYLTCGPGPGAPHEDYYTIYLPKFQTLVRDLNPIASSVERLLVTFDIDLSSVNSIDRWISYFGSVYNLAPFTSLKELEVIEQFLVSEKYRKGINNYPNLSQVFPPMLQVLTIIAPSGKTLPWLAELAQSSTTVPLLRKIELRCMSRHGRSASWFHKHGSSVFEKLKQSNIHATITTVSCALRASIKPSRRSRYKSFWE